MGNFIAIVSSWIRPRRDADKDTVNSTNPIQQCMSYSWDQRKKGSTEQSYVKGLTDQAYSQSLENHEKQCLYIQNCSNSLLLITGICDSVYIDDCTNCKIVLGPVKRSVFMRKCNVTLVACICGQFRTRDCAELTCFLSCPSQPTIESSSIMRFSYLSINYPSLKVQLDKIGYNYLQNKWFEIFDFTPNTACTGVDLNWSLLTAEERIGCFLSRHEQEFYEKAEISFSDSESAVHVPKFEPLENITDEVK